MTAFDDLMKNVNDSCLAHLGGQEFGFTRINSLEQPDDPATFPGIIDIGVEFEGAAPGDGSIYALLNAFDAAVALKLQKGDEISTATDVYLIVEMRQDAKKGLKMLLRRDRELV